MGEDFDAQVGFVPRTNFFAISLEAQLFFYPRSGALTQHGPGADVNLLYQLGFGKADHEMRLNWEADFRNTARMRLALVNEETYLFEEFDPTRTDSKALPDSVRYNYTSYTSNRSKKLSFELRPSAGQFFNGNRYSLSSSLTYRYQPFGAIEVNVNYAYIDLPYPYSSTGLFLIGPRIDLTFSKSIFLTTFLQYNDQRKNFNINTRFQWRFAPVSDFFLVYTDNYLTDGIFEIRNRSVVAKVTYWLNL